MHAIDFLTTHHREMETKLDALKDAQTVQPSDFEQMAKELAAHITVEEELFYPAVKGRRTEDILLESLEEHLSLKRVLADLLAIEPTDVKFGPKLHVLAEQAAHHHKEEEEHLFPKVKRLFEPEALEELGAQMQRRMGSLVARAVHERIPEQTGDSATLA